MVVESSSAEHQDRHAPGSAPTGGSSPAASPSAQDDWTRHRHEVFAVQEEGLRRARQAEHERATEKILAAIAEYRAAGIDPLPLRAKPYTGGGTIRTTLTGWYLKKDCSIAVDVDGRFYILRVDGGLRSRLRGATPEPSLAPLVVGRGARDGETFTIDELLQMRLEDPVRP